MAAGRRLLAALDGCPMSVAGLEALLALLDRDPRDDEPPTLTSSPLFSAAAADDDDDEHSIEVGRTRALYVRVLSIVGQWSNAEAAALWSRARDFERALLGDAQAVLEALRSDDDDVIAEAKRLIDEQESRVVELYRLELRVPRADVESVWADCQRFASGCTGGAAAALAGAAGRRLLVAAQRKWAAQAALEEDLAAAWAAVADDDDDAAKTRLQLAVRALLCWLVDDPSVDGQRLVGAFERAVLVHAPDSVATWRRYLDYAVAQWPGPPTLQLAQRAVRRFPDAADVWLDYLAAQPSLLLMHEALGRGLAALRRSPLEQLQLYEFYLGALVRDADAALAADVLNSTFDRAADCLLRAHQQHVRQTRGRDSDAACAVYMQRLLGSAVYAEHARLALDDDLIAANLLDRLQRCRDVAASLARSARFWIALTQRVVARPSLVRRIFDLAGQSVPPGDDGLEALLYARAAYEHDRGTTQQFQAARLRLWRCQDDAEHHRSQNQVRSSAYQQWQAGRHQHSSIQSIIDQSTSIIDQSTSIIDQSTSIIDQSTSIIDQSTSNPSIMDQSIMDQSTSDQSTSRKRLQRYDESDDEVDKRQRVSGDSSDSDHDEKESRSDNGLVFVVTLKVRNLAPSATARDLEQLFADCDVLAVRVAIDHSASRTMGAPQHRGQAFVDVRGLANSRAALAKNGSAVGGQEVMVSVAGTALTTVQHRERPVPLDSEALHSCIVRNLHAKTKEIDVARQLGVDDLVEARIVRDEQGKSRHFAFVDYASEQALHRALLRNGAVVRGCTWRVEEKRRGKAQPPAAAVSVRGKRGVRGRLGFAAS